MFKKRVIAAAACALAMAGAAHAVEVSRDGTGDLLIAPAYFIGGGMSTDLKVINTSSTQSVVAKVVFRDQVSSAEVLDFLIYLSPSDVWNGTVSCKTADANGQCIESVVTSTDDSIQLPGSTAFASASNPAEIVSPAEGRVALPNQGYIEVLMGSAYDITPFKPGVNKNAIVAEHTQAGPIVAVTATPNVLTGSVTANAPGLGAATLPMLALEDYNNSAKVDVGIVSGLDLVTQRTTVADVEEALWVNNITVPYSVGDGKLSLVTYTFPTKLTYNQVTDGQYPFGVKTCVSGDVYDNSENVLIGATFNVSPLPKSKVTCLNEFQWLIFGSDIATTDGTRSFTDGWARLSFVRDTTSNQNGPGPVAAAGSSRVGVPAIATYMQKDTTAGKFTWAYASNTR